jgi:membrane fusion protein (multidrug efflux system)
VEGYLESVEFEDGAQVKKGDVLYQIDEAPYQAALDAAQAQLESAKASKARAEADLKNAQVNLERQQKLLQRDTVSQATVDDATARRDEAAAAVEMAKAQIASAQAAITTAKLNLGYTTITAAIDGRMGKSQVTAGNLISPSSGTMATLVQLDPIRVAFALPDRLYTQFQEAAGNASAEAARAVFEPRVTLPNGRVYETAGEISFASNEIDPATGTITVYAKFDNPRAFLLPGAFLVVSVARTDVAETPTVPASAILRDQQGPYVFVLSDDDTAKVRRVTLGDRSGAVVGVREGLSEGETVIVEGVQKVVPGGAVRPTSTTIAAADAPSAETQ